MASNTKQQVCNVVEDKPGFRILTVCVTVFFVFAHGLFKLSVLYDKHVVLTDN